MSSENGDGRKPELPRAGLSRWAVAVWVLLGVLALGGLTAGAVGLFLRSVRTAFSGMQ